MYSDKTARRKKPYSKPKLKLLDPQETLARIKAAAQAGDNGAQAMLNCVSALHRRS